MCGACFIFSLIAYILISARFSVRRQYKEWLDSQHEVRRHVTSVEHRSIYKIKGEDHV